MSLMRMPFTMAGEWISGITVVALIIAGTGCAGVDLPGGDGNTDKYGLIVNTDTSKDLIGGVRTRNSGSVFAFGRFNPNGSIAEVTSVVFENGAGKKATLFFKFGWPSRAVGFDGSVMTIDYEEVNAQRLSGTVTFTPVGGPTRSWEFVIDLQQTAAQIADLVVDLTGIEITNQNPPNPSASQPADDDKTVVADKSSRSDSSLLVVVVVPIVLVLTGFTIHLTLGQMLKSFVETADAVGEALMIAFLTPFILMGNLMRLALGQPLVTISYNQGDPTLYIPRPE
jgi:hypothetical protein